MINWFSSSVNLVECEHLRLTDDARYIDILIHGLILYPTTIMNYLHLFCVTAIDELQVQGHALQLEIGYSCS